MPFLSNLSLVFFFWLVLYYETPKIRRLVEGIFQLGESKCGRMRECGTFGWIQERETMD